MLSTFEGFVFVIPTLLVFSCALLAMTDYVIDAGGLHLDRFDVGRPAQSARNDY